MWFSLKAGPEPGMKFIKLHISNSDDSEGSLALGHLVIQMLLYRALGSRMGKNAVVSAWMKGGKSPSKEMKSQDVCAQSLPEVTKSPCVQEPKSNDTQFLPTRTVESNRKEELQGKAALFCSQSLGQLTQWLLDTCWARPCVGSWGDMGEQNLVSVLMELLIKKRILNIVC